LKLVLLGTSESIPWHAPVGVGAVPAAMAVAIPVWMI